MSQISELDVACPALGGSKLGTKVNQLITLINELKTNFNAHLTKLDTDAVAQNSAVAASQLDTDYSSSGAASSADVDTISWN